MENDKSNCARENNLDDVFMTEIDEKTSQKIISEIEDRRELNSIKNVKNKVKYSQHTTLHF